MGATMSVSGHVVRAETFMLPKPVPATPIDRPAAPQIRWRQTGRKSYVVECIADGAPTLHRYFTSAEGARACAASWGRFFGPGVEAVRQ